MNLYKILIPIALIVTIIFILYGNDKDVKIDALKENNEKHKVFIDSLERAYDSLNTYYSLKEDSLLCELISRDSIIQSINKELEKNTLKIKNTFNYEEISNPDSLDNYIDAVILGNKKPK